MLALKVDKNLTRSQRIELADLVIEHIYERTNSGKDVSGKPFKAYTKEYVNSLTGQIGGKGKKVNLQLSGDMLASMALIKQEKGKIVIGFDSEDERAKAEGNILGSYGQPHPNPDKARPFFGIKPEKLKELIAYVTD